MNEVYKRFLSGKARKIALKQYRKNLALDEKIAKESYKKYQKEESL